MNTLTSRACRSAILMLAGTLIALPGCAMSQDTNANTAPRSSSPPSTPTAAAAPMAALGEIVADIGNSCWYVFQDKDNNYWFGSDGNGVCRYDGKTLTRFTTKDGLVHDQIRGIQQHASTGHILITTNGGVSTFDGQQFVTLQVTDMKPPGIPLTLESADHPDALAQEGWVLNGDDEWLTGSGGPRRYDGKTLYQLKFPKSSHADEWHARYPETRWNPYDVWTVYKDRRGHVWFGAGGMGVCRFDGRSLDWMFEPHLTEVPGAGWFGFRSIIEDKDGAFWICNTKYRYKIEPHGAPGQQAGRLTYTREQGVDPAAIPPGESPIYYQGVVDDERGDLWMATYGFGVWRFDGTKMTHYFMQAGEPPNVVTLFSIFKDNFGGLWAASQEHGAYKFNGTVFEKFKPESPEHQATAASQNATAPAEGEIVADIDPTYGSVFQDKDLNYWFTGGDRGVYRYDGKSTTRFTTKDGLPSDQVGGIQQHATTGDIVLVTSNGFSRFDGRAFTNLNVADPSKSEWKLQADDLWFPAGQDTGAVYRYDGKVMHRLTFPPTAAGDAHYAELPRDKFPNAKYSPYDVYIIFRDSRGHVWFGTATLGACRYDGTSFAWFAKPGIDLANFGTRSIIEDNNGKFWFSSTLNRYAIDAAPASTPFNEKGDIAIKYHMEPGIGEGKDPFSFFMSAVKDKNGDLWLATLGASVFRYDGSNMTHYSVEYDEAMLNGISIYLDRQNNPWLGSQKDGVYKFNGKTFERFVPPAPVEGQIIEPRKNDPYFTPTGARTTPYMPKVIIRNILQDRAGNIWFATFGGPIRYDGKEFRNFAEEVGLATTRIFSVLEVRSGATIWFGSITGGATRYDGQTFTKFTEKDGLASNDVHWIFEDRDGDIWFGTTNGVSRYDGKTFTNFTTKDGLVDNSVYTIGQDAAGRIWFGTQGGICSYDGTPGSFSNFADQVGRSFSNIRAMAVDRSGNLWFGGQDGAYRYNGKTLTTFTSNEGLLDDFVGSMIVDRAGNVWLGHPGHAGQRGGASRYDGKSFKHFTEKDGLNSGNVYAIGEDKAGSIWFGSVDAGACRFDGKTFTNFSATAP